MNNGTGVGLVESTTRSAVAQRRCARCFSTPSHSRCRVTSWGELQPKRDALRFFVSLASVRRRCGAIGARWFDPNPNGGISVVVVQPDGKILLGGAFTTLAPNGGAAVTRNRIARLNPDGTLDTGFNPNSDNNVNAIAVQGDGKILVGGWFASIGGQTRNHIARLDPTTGLADSLDPNANNIIYSIVVQADGKVLVGGAFTNSADSAQQIARLDPDRQTDSFVQTRVAWCFHCAQRTARSGAHFHRDWRQIRNGMARLNPITVWRIR